MPVDFLTEEQKQRFRIEREKGPSGQEQDKLVLTGLEKIDEPDSLRLVRHRVPRRLPPINLPELLLELHVRTGFLSEFTHIHGSKSRISDLPISLIPLLLDFEEKVLLLFPITTTKIETTLATGHTSQQ